MKKRMIAVLAAALTASMTFGMTAFAAQDLKIGWQYEPASVDGAHATDDASYEIVKLASEALLRNVNGEAKEGIAESYEANEDNTEYTFHLRESVFWDGTAVTAEDFKYGMMRMLDPEQAFEQASTLYVIEGAQAYNAGEGSADAVGIEVVDDYTLKLKMNAPTYPIYFTRWEFAPVSKDFAEPLGATYGAEAANVLSNGPYKVDSWTHDSEVVLVKNENYWNADAIKLDSITCVISAVNDTGVDMLLAGELDATTVQKATQVATLEDAGFTVGSYQAGSQYIHINQAGKTEDTSKFLGNTNFRLALSYALNRVALCQAVYTTDTPANRISQPSQGGVEGFFVDEYPYEGWPLEGDTEKAKEYLAAALEEIGCTIEEVPVFTMLCYDSENNMLAMNAIADMWSKALGIRCEIDAQPLSSMISKVYSSDYDFWKGGSDPGIIDWLDGCAYEYKSDAGAPFNMTDPKVDELYDAVYYSVDWKEREDSLFELEKYLCENGYDLLVTHINSNEILSERVSNAYITKYIDFTYAELAE